MASKHLEEIKDCQMTIEHLMTRANQCTSDIQATSDKFEIQVLRSTLKIIMDEMLTVELNMDKLKAELRAAIADMIII